MTDHRVLCAVLRLERIDFSVIQRQPPSDRKSLSLLAVLLKADSIQCLLTDGCNDETYFNWFRDKNRREVVCLARMQIFDASTADGFVEGRLGFGPQPEAAEWPPLGPPLEGRVAETPGNALWCQKCRPDHKLSRPLDKILTKSEKLWRKIVRSVVFPLKRSSFKPAEASHRDSIKGTK